MLAAIACIAVPGIVTYYIQENLQKTYHDETLRPLSNAHPAICWDGC